MSKSVKYQRQKVDNKIVPYNKNVATAAQLREQAPSIMRPRKVNNSTQYAAVMPVVVRELDVATRPIPKRAPASETKAAVKDFVKPPINMIQRRAYIQYEASQPVGYDWRQNTRTYKMLTEIGTKGLSESGSLQYDLENVMELY